MRHPRPSDSQPPSSSCLSTPTAPTAATSSTASSSTTVLRASSTSHSVIRTLRQKKMASSPESRRTSFAAPNVASAILAGLDAMHKAQLENRDGVCAFVRNIVSAMSSVITDMRGELDKNSTAGGDLLNSTDTMESLRSRLQLVERTNHMMTIHLDLLDLQKKLEAEEIHKIDDRKTFVTATREELYKEIVELLEAEFSCSICNEVFVAPSVTKCGHTFCELCIATWTKDKLDCPICRTVIFTDWGKHVEMDNFITRLHLRLSDEIRQTREALVQERTGAMEELRSTPPTRRGNTSTLLQAIRLLQDQRNSAIRGSGRASSGLRRRMVDIEAYARDHAYVTSTTLTSDAPARLRSRLQILDELQNPNQNGSLNAPSTGTSAPQVPQLISPLSPIVPPPFSPPGSREIQLRQLRCRSTVERLQVAQDEARRHRLDNRQSHSGNSQDFVAPLISQSEPMIDECALARQRTLISTTEDAQRTLGLIPGASPASRLRIQRGTRRPGIATPLRRTFSLPTENLDENDSARGTVATTVPTPASHQAIVSTSSAAHDNRPVCMDVDERFDNRARWLASHPEPLININESDGSVSISRTVAATGLNSSPPASPVAPSRLLQNAINIYNPTGPGCVRFIPGGSRNSMNSVRGYGSVTNTTLSSGAPISSTSQGGNDRAQAESTVTQEQDSSTAAPTPPDSGNATATSSPNSTENIRTVERYLYSLRSRQQRAMDLTTSNFFVAPSVVIEAAAVGDIRPADDQPQVTSASTSRVAPESRSSSTDEEMYIILQDGCDVDNSNSSSNSSEEASLEPRASTSTAIQPPARSSESLPIIMECDSDSDSPSTPRPLISLNERNSSPNRSRPDLTANDMAFIYSMAVMDEEDEEHS